MCQSLKLRSAQEVAIQSTSLIQGRSAREEMKLVFRARSALNIPEDCADDSECTIGKCVGESAVNGFGIQVMTCQLDLARPCNLMFTQVDSFFNYIQATLCVDAEVLCNALKNLTTDREKRIAERRLKRLQNARDQDSFLEVRDPELVAEQGLLLERRSTTRLDNLMIGCNA